MTFRNSYPLRLCDFCGQEISSLRRNDSKFCSDRCRVAAHRGQVRPQNEAPAALAEQPALTGEDRAGGHGKWGPKDLEIAERILGGEFQTQRVAAKVLDERVRRDLADFRNCEQVRRFNLEDGVESSAEFLAQHRQRALKLADSIQVYFSALRGDPEEALPPDTPWNEYQ